MKTTKITTSTIPILSEPPPLVHVMPMLTNDAVFKVNSRKDDQGVYHDHASE